jgi:hypothetical protein
MYDGWAIVMFVCVHVNDKCLSPFLMPLCMRMYAHACHLSDSLDGFPSSMYVCIRPSLYVYMYVSMRMYVCMYVCIYVCIQEAHIHIFLCFFLMMSNIVGHR